MQKTMTAMCVKSTKTFSIRFFLSTFKAIRHPRRCPTVVIEPIQQSFRLFFASPSSAANQIRIAIEELLTVLKIKRQTKVNGTVKPIALHSRILMLPAKYKNLAQVMIAMKWLENHGSHGGKKKLSMDDVLDLYEFTEHILKEIYQPSVVEVMAKRVNKRKGPLKKT